MSSTYIRNSHGEIIGKIEGNQAWNGRGNYVGRYDKNTNYTHDASGRIIGTGNQLAFLIRDK